MIATNKSMLTFSESPKNTLLPDQISIKEIRGKTTAPIFHVILLTLSLFLNIDRTTKETMETIKNKNLNPNSVLEGSVYQSKNPNIKKKDPIKRKIFNIKVTVKTPRILFPSFSIEI